MTEEAVQKIARCQTERLLRHLKDDIPFSDAKIDENIYPQLVKVSFYYTEYFEEVKKIDPNQVVKFKDLISENKGDYVVLTGPPGSGKTTIAKRLSCQTSAAEYFFYVSLMEVVPNGPITYKQLLLDHIFPDISEEIRKDAFRWIKENPDRCVVILDGYDQAIWSIQDLKPQYADYETPKPVNQLVSNMCCRNVFSEATLMLTSRSHALLSIPSYFRAKNTLLVHDLEEKDMKKFFFLIARENATEAWQRLHDKASHLLYLCYNPLLLQFVVNLLLDDSIPIQSITILFQKVIESIHRQNSSQAGSKDLMNPMSSLAFKGMEKSVFLFEVDDLQKEGLTEVKVQDFVISFGKLPKSGGQRLFDGDKRFYFCHQTLQEYFAAHYIAKLMPYNKFSNLIPQIFHERRWSMVKRFLVGLLLEGAPASTHDDKVFDLEAQLFQLTAFQKDCKEIKKHNAYDLLEIMVDLQDCEKMIQHLAEQLCPNLHFMGFPLSLNACYALGQFLQHTHKDIVQLSFVQCNLKGSTLQVISNAIKEGDCMVKKLVVCDCTLVGNDGPEIMCDSIIKLDALTLENCGITKINNLCKKIRVNEKRICLNLWANQIQNDELTALAECVPFLDALELDHNHITDVIDFAECFKVPSVKMTVLSLRYNMIGDLGARAMMGCIHNVGKMDLAGCNISQGTKNEMSKKIGDQGLHESSVLF